MTRNIVTTARCGLRLVMASAFLAAGLLADPIISFQITSLGVQNGTPLFRETFYLSGLNLASNFEVDVNFDPATYQSLSNGVANSDFDLLLFQPNQPPGEPGVYSALALVNNPSLTGPFSVDFSTVIGTIPPPCGTLQANPCQPFFIYDDSNITGPNGGLVFHGFLTPAPEGAPEPFSFGVTAIGLAFVMGGIGLRRRNRSG